VAVRTIFTMAEDCARGERLGWREFVRDYAPIARTLLAHYFPSLVPEMDAHVTAVFQRARAGDNAWFRSLKFTNEREFAMSFRGLALAYGREVARVPAPELSLDEARELMRKLPVVEREVLWLFVKGYDAPRIAAMMMHAEATVAEVKRLADERRLELLPAASAEAYNVSARALMEQAEAARGEHCLPLKTFNNLVNGQVSWRERDQAEQHIGDCMYCLDRFTSFQEMIRLRQDARPAPDTEIERVLGQLNLPPASSKGLLGKLFGT
jgi:hypothetical protein